MEIKGIIKQVAREGKAVMLDNDTWYSHFSATTQFVVGDSVKVTYTDKVKGDVTYHNWTLIEPGDEVFEVVKPGEVLKKTEENYNKGTSFYTAYAKDIYNVMWKEEEDVDSTILMKEAIKLVKQAKEAFE